MIAGQATWAGIVLASAYLLFKFADDVWMALLSSRGSFSERLQKGLGVAPRMLDQAAVVLSALSRILIFFCMVVAFIAPLGSNPGQLLQRSGKYGSGLKVGEFDLLPGAIFTFLAVLTVGFIGLRLFKRWLKDSYLPNTNLEAGMRGSPHHLARLRGRHRGDHRRALGARHQRQPHRLDRECVVGGHRLRLAGHRCRTSSRA